jgi:hypothetical protein
MSLRGPSYEDGTEEAEERLKQLVSLRSAALSSGQGEIDVVGETGRIIAGAAAAPAQGTTRDAEGYVAYDLSFFTPSTSEATAVLPAPVSALQGPDDERQLPIPPPGPADSIRRRSVPFFAIEERAPFSPTPVLPVSEPGARISWRDSPAAIPTVEDRLAAPSVGISQQPHAPSQRGRTLTQAGGVPMRRNRSTGSTTDYSYLLQLSGNLRNRTWPYLNFGATPASPGRGRVLTRTLSLGDSSTLSSPSSPLSPNLTPALPFASLATPSFEGFNPTSSQQRPRSVDLSFYGRPPPAQSAAGLVSSAGGASAAGPTITQAAPQQSSEPAIAGPTRGQITICPICNVTVQSVDYASHWVSHLNERGDVQH